MEVWAAIDLLQGKVVTLRQGDASKKMEWDDEPLEMAKRWEDSGADGLHIIDLDGAFERGSNQMIVETIVKRSGIRVQVGGGVRSEERVKQLLDAGVDRVILGTLAYKNPSLLARILKRFGSEKIVIAADYKTRKIVSRGWKENEGLEVLTGISNLQTTGVKNVLVTDVERDGLGEGPDVAMMRMIRSSTEMNVLASGGIRNAPDVEQLRRAGADGVVLGRAIYEGTINIGELRR